MLKKRKNRRIKGLSLQVLPFSEFEDMGISERVRKILKLILENKIIILHGRLRVEEEARLIEDTMALVDHVKNFKGIELAVIEPDLRDKGVFYKLRHRLAKSIIGSDNSALTIIGPASVIREIKRDPKKLELFFEKF